MPKFIVWRLWSIYFDHHLPLKPSIGKRRKQSCTLNTCLYHLLFFSVWVLTNSFIIFFEVLLIIIIISTFPKSWLSYFLNWLNFYSFVSHIVRLRSASASLALITTNGNTFWTCCGCRRKCSITFVSNFYQMQTH